LALSLAGLALAGCVNTPRPTPDTRLPTAFEAPDRDGPGGPGPLVDQLQ
jgi:hypothetical protein